MAVDGVLGLACDPGYVLHGYATWWCSASLVWQPIGEFSNASGLVNNETETITGFGTTAYCLGKTSLIVHPPATATTCSPKFTESITKCFYAYFIAGLCG